MLLFIFFFNDTATTEIYTLSLHDALPISRVGVRVERVVGVLERLEPRPELVVQQAGQQLGDGQERLPLLGDRKEHTSELQSRQYLVCRLLLEKKKKIDTVSLAWS